MPSVLRRGDFRNIRKGVTPVIATILLVMVTVMLVVYSYDFFSEVAEGAQDYTTAALEENEKMGQQVTIPTVYGCGPYICFELKALGTNKWPLPIDGAGFYLDDVPEKVYPWPGANLGAHCSENPVLAPGESCYGRIMEDCEVGSLLRIQLSWGMSTFRTIARC